MKVVLFMKYGKLISKQHLHYFHQPAKILTAFNLMNVSRI